MANNKIAAAKKHLDEVNKTEVELTALKNPEKQKELLDSLILYSGIRGKVKLVVEDEDVALSEEENTILTNANGFISFLRENGVSEEKIKKIEDIMYDEEINQVPEGTEKEQNPETVTETYEQKLGKYVQSLFGDSVVTTVSEALREEYGNGKRLWTEEINGVKRDYIKSNQVWREIVGDNEGQILADFQGLLSVLFKERGKTFNLIEGTDVGALQKNMEENIYAIDRFRNYHNDGGRFYKYCLERFGQPTGMVDENGNDIGKSNFYFAIPSFTSKTLILIVSKNGWALHDGNDDNTGFVRPGLPKNSGK